MEKIELEQLIRKHNDLYWNGIPEISDVEYDRLVRALAAIDPDNELVTRFAVPKMSGDTVVHTKPMLSLGKVYSLAELLEWVKKVARSKNEKFRIQPKYDGLSGKLENGILASRGDGKVGQNYTSKLALIKLDTDKNIDVRKDYMLGEILITNDDFNTVFKNITTKAGIPFKNQRNGVAGIIGADDIKFYQSQTDKKLLTFVDYDKFNWHVTAAELEEKWNEIVDAIQQLPYPMDGIVIKLDDTEYAESLGYTEHHPKGAIAFKYTNQFAWTKLLDVEWSQGKDQLGAVAILEPIDISGITIKRAKLQMMPTVDKNGNQVKNAYDGTLQIGDYVKVERAGDIIPHIADSKPGEERTRIVLDVCPFCGSKVIVHDSFIECSNPNCSDKVINRLMFAMKTLRFKGVAEAYATKMHTLLNVNTVYDLMNVKQSDLLAYKDFGNKNVENFISEQQKAKKNATMNEVLVAMDLDGIGKKNAEILLDNYTLADLTGLNISFSSLCNLNGIGEINAMNIISALRIRRDEITSTLALFDSCSPGHIEQQSAKLDVSVCFTGKMCHPRSEMSEIAKAAGMEVLDSVTNNLTYLVCADPNSGSSKLKNAAKKGIKIISEQEFLDMTKKN